VTLWLILFYARIDSVEIFSHDRDSGLRHCLRQSSRSVPVVLNGQCRSLMYSLDERHNKVKTHTHSLHNVIQYFWCTCNKTVTTHSISSLFVTNESTFILLKRQPLYRANPGHLNGELHKTLSVVPTLQPLKLYYSTHYLYKLKFFFNCIKC
jgi:hypothetical protein